MIRAGGWVIGAALATALTVIAVPTDAGGQTTKPAATTAPADAGSSGAGYRLLATAQAGAVLVNDPTFLVPYADQVVLSARGDLSAVNAFAEATPLNPGSVASLAPALFAVGCPTCPAPPALPKITATAQPPESESDRVAPGELKLGDIVLGGPQASAAAKVGDHVDALAATDDITGLQLAPGVMLKSATAHTVLRAPTAAKPDAAEATASAETHIGPATIVALAQALPKPKAVIGVKQPDGTVSPIAASGVSLGSDARLLPSTSTQPTSARAGAVLERTAADGTVQRVTVLLTSAEALGRLQVPAVPIPSALGPLTSGTGTSEVQSPSVAAALPSAAFQPARSEPTPSAAAIRARPVIRPLSRPAFAIHHRRTWLLWLFAAWLCLGAAALAAGRRWLAPRIAADASVGRAARAAALDHLDQA